MMRHEEHGQWLTDVRAALSGSALVEPPQWVRERGRRVYAVPGRREASLIDRVLIRAALLFDSRRAGPSAAGVRSLGVSEGSREGPWQLLYRGGDVDVDLLVRPNLDGRTMNVRGQALSLAGDAVADGVVEALPAADSRSRGVPPRASARTEVQPTGEFALANLERGRYNVLLHFGTREIELSGVEL